MDWNHDGRADLVSGDSEGSVWLFLNAKGGPEPELAKGVRIEAAGRPIGPLPEGATGPAPAAKVYSKIHVADWDADGLPDLLVGQDTEVLLYRNVGTAEIPKFAAPVEIAIPEKKFPFRPSPYVCDWDGDGKKDLLIGCEDPRILFYRNTGSAEKPVLAKAEDLGLAAAGFERSYRCRVAVTDWNNDGKADLLVGTACQPAARGRTTGYVWLFLAK